MKTDAQLKKDVEAEPGWGPSVGGDTATPSGSVHSWAERAVVQQSAWSAPGIQRLVNELKGVS